MKKILSVALLAVFMFTMNLGMLDDFGVKEAKGDTTYKITVTNPSDSGVTFDGKTFTAYKIFDLVKGAGDSGYSYTPTAAFKSYTYNGKTGQQLVNELIGYSGNTDKLNSFASAVFSDISGGVDNNGLDYSELAYKSVVGTSSDSVVIDLDGTSTEGKSLGAGYYLVAGEAKPTDGEPQTLVAACALTTADKQANVTAKLGAPTIEKKIVSGSDEVAKHSANIGDSVTFRIRCKVPDMTGYSAYTFVIHDTLSKGLNNGKTSPTLKQAILADGATATTGTSITSYCVVADDGTSSSEEKKFKITVDLKAASATAGKYVVIDYTVPLNNSALTTLVETNKAYLEYSSDPYNSNSTNKTAEKTVYVSDFDIVIDKVDGGNQEKLQNVQFKLYNDSNQFYKVSTDQETQGVVTWGTEDEATIVTTDGSGSGSFKGLAAGTYYLKEIKTNDGYNLLSDPVKVVITDGCDASGRHDSSSATFNGAPATPNTASNVSFTGTIANNKGEKLPETGGIGTTIFYIVGGALMIGALVLLLTKKKMSSK